MNEYEKAMAEAIAEYLWENNSIRTPFEIEIEVNNITCCVSGWGSIDRWRDDNYYYGTGDYIVQNARVEIEEESIYNEEGEIVPIPFSSIKIQERAEEIIKK